MKKLLLIITLFIAVNLKAQDKQPKDTTISVTLNINQFRALLTIIDQSIDSKKQSREILDFLQTNARIINPTIDGSKKPEEAKKAAPKN